MEELVKSRGAAVASSRRLLLRMPMISWTTACRSQAQTVVMTCK